MAWIKNQAGLTPDILPLRDGIVKARRRRSMSIPGVWRRRGKCDLLISVNAAARPPRHAVIARQA
jgi:hypothetical protein